MKTKKEKMSSNGSREKFKAQEKKIERLELLSLAQDLENTSIKTQALKVKIQQLNTEATMLNRELGTVQEEAQSMLTRFSSNLEEYKKKHKVPEGKEVNLRTGEIVEPPPQQAPPQQEVEQVPNPQ